MDMQSPLGTSLKELGARPRIHLTEVVFIAKLFGAMPLLTRISQTIYSKLISGNSHHSRKLWHVLRKTLNRVSDLCKLLFGVLQGSVLGPWLLSLYTIPLSFGIGKHKGIKLHFYANASQVYVHLF